MTATPLPSSLKTIARHPAFIGVSSIFLLTVIIFFPTWKSLVDIWTRSETFAHGFIVIPISLWVIWQNKALHNQIIPKGPSWLGLGFTAVNGFVWLLASLIHALVIQQYALVGILIGGIWFYLGNETTKKLIFPLTFLYFMVPVGEALLPYLMQYTADFTVYLLRKTGLSVYREGMHFSLVTGDWSVVEACSGLRYLIASIMLGTIYAYITYQKNYKRALFILFSIILPIIANGFRAYMIVMIGHLSGMKLAVGVDHLIYGAIFFTFIIFIMFYIGSFWRDDPIEIQDVSAKQANKPYNNQKRLTPYSSILLLTTCFAIWPLANHWLQSHYHADTSLPNWPPLTQNPNWHEVQPPAWPWHPKFEQAVNDSTRYFQHKKNGLISGFYQANFGEEKQGAELVSTHNVLRRYNPSIKLNERQIWYILMQFDVQTNTSLPYHVTVMRSDKHMVDFIIIQWYSLNHFHTHSDYLAKLYQLYKRLTLNNTAETSNILFFKVEQSFGINSQMVLKHIQQQTPLNLEITQNVNLSKK